jgi:hypothetical protein
MLFILEGTYLAFSRISGLPGVELICENRQADFSWLLNHLRQLEPPTSFRQKTQGSVVAL